jgi:hypothetical protein
VGREKRVLGEKGLLLVTILGYLLSEKPVSQY